MCSDLVQCGLFLLEKLGISHVWWSSVLKNLKCSELDAAIPYAMNYEVGWLAPIERVYIHAFHCHMSGLLL